MADLSQSPFQHEYFLGYANQITPQYVRVHFPSSVLLNSYSHYGIDLNGGLVGSFVAIEGDTFGFIGKIIELGLPESERLELNEKAFQTSDFHPFGKVEILLSFDLFEPEKVERGLNSLPVIGAKVFVCSSEFIGKYFKRFGVRSNNSSAPVFELGKLTYDRSSAVEISQQAIFGRHCAVVGTTGGGKSYTTSKLIEGLVSNGHKSIIVDATGEYTNHDKETYSDKALILSHDAYFPYSRLTINDLFVLFRPSGQVQQPILIEAIKSLKIVHCLMRDKAEFTTTESGTSITFQIKTKSGDKELVIEKGCLIKKGNLTAPVKSAYYKYVDEIEDNSKCDFNIENLARQIINECYYDNGDKWSDRQDERNFSNSTSLLMRINSILNDETYKRLFGFNVGKEKNLVEAISSFLANKKTLLRISFDRVPFSFQSREIMANAIGKYLLALARSQKFKDTPLVLFVDEAHQFLNKNVKDEYFEQTELSAFDSIAKECRKYGLFLCVTTQMPRDIPIGTLSQIGTFIVHRLINHYDKESIANASSSANRSTLSFLPVLGSGEAILMGVDFPMPVMMKINEPKVKPDSSTPEFK